MRKILFICALMLTTVSVSAQDAFKKGDLVAGLGIGIGNTLHSGSVSFPPLSVDVEYGVVDGLLDGKASIGVGGLLGYSASSEKYFTAKAKYSDFYLGARGNFHYQFIDKLDTYAGLSLGYDIVSVSHENAVGNYSADGSTLFFGFHLGARYYFAEQFAAMAELGYDVAILRLGVAYKF